jgi:transposase-like protein
MARLVAQWGKSGESGASFARRHQIPAWTFWYWRRKLSAGASAVASAPAPTFVPVQVTIERGEPVLEIVLSGGERLEVRAGASADLVRAAVSALRSAC